jgi:hypothetical protein
VPLVIGFVALIGAALLLTSAVTDASFADVITGKAGQVYRTNEATSSTTAGASTPSSTTTSTPSVAGTGDISAANLATIAKGLGYSWDATEIAAWQGVIGKEDASGSPTAQNPTSTAYGIGQFLNSTWASFGPKTSDPHLQLVYMAEYIKEKYGTPSAALAHENTAGYY